MHPALAAFVARTQGIVAVFEHLKECVETETFKTPADIVAARVFKELLANDHETLVREVAAGAQMIAASIDADGLVSMDREVASELIKEALDLNDKIEKLEQVSREAMAKIKRLIAENN